MSDRIQLDLERCKVVYVGATSHDVADIIRLEDGLWYYQQSDGKALAPWTLRVIAELLDEANKEWEGELDKAYGG